MMESKCPKCGSKENPLHVFDFERGIEFLRCKTCGSWFEIQDGRIVSTRRRPRGIGRKYVKCPKCGQPIRKSYLNRSYICIPNGHLFGSPEILEQVRRRIKTREREIPIYA